MRNNSGIKQSNTILNNKGNINNTLYRNYRNNSCSLRNKKNNCNKKSNIFSSINRNYYKSNNNNSIIINKQDNKVNKIRRNNNNINEYITINNNYYTIISNTTVNNINGINNYENFKYENINNILQINKNENNSTILNEKNMEKEIKNEIEKDNNIPQIINKKNKIIKKENEIPKLSFIDKIKEKNQIALLKKPIKSNNLYSKNNNYNASINNSINKKSVESQRPKDILSININSHQKSRNKSNLNKQFNTNNNINNITCYKKQKFNILENSTFSEKKSLSKQKLNQSFNNRKKNDNISHGKRIIKIKQNNDNYKLSLKEKIHLFQQRKEALIKQYLNKNRSLKGNNGSNLNRKKRKKN